MYNEIQIEMIYNRNEDEINSKQKLIIADNVLCG